MDFLLDQIVLSTAELSACHFCKLFCIFQLISLPLSLNKSPFHFVFQFAICCSLCLCIFFLAIEKPMNESTKRPETIITEINGINSKIDSSIILL